MEKMELDEVWTQSFGDTEPLAHLIRARFSTRWVRLHSLPHAKRYPDTEEEMAIVLSRHNAVIDWLVDAEEQLALLSTGYSEEELPTCSEFSGHSLPLEEIPWRSVPMHEMDDGLEHPSYWHVFRSSVAWRSGALDAVFRLVAEDSVANVMLLSTGGWLYHPYDGGADVILPFTLQRERLITEFSGWVSSHPLGL